MLIPDSLPSSTHVWHITLQPKKCLCIYPFDECPDADPFHRSCIMIIQKKASIREMHRKSPIRREIYVRFNRRVRHFTCTDIYVSIDTAFF